MDSVSSVLDTILCEMEILFLFRIDLLRNMYLDQYLNLNTYQLKSRTVWCYF